jgi:uracil-DNA glycosylase
MNISGLDNHLGQSLADCFAGIPEAWLPITDQFTQGRSALIDRVDADAPHVAPADPFRALRYATPEQVRVVLIGQDPYPKPGHAQGLAFSCDIAVPHSMGRSVYPALKQVRPDFKPPRHADLTPWAQQGVLLLNTVLTVRLNDVGSHLNIGWQPFTALLVRALLKQLHPPYFLLWGSQAQNFFAEASAGLVVDSSHVLKARHPSNDFKGEFVAQAAAQFTVLHEALPDIDWWALK